MRRLLIVLLLLAGLCACYAYDQYVFNACRAAGRSSAACLAEMGNI
jgi:hypothetical protein